MINDSANSGKLLRADATPDAINFLRTVATLMVFNQHMQQIENNALISRLPFGVLFRSCAWAGVWIFFILSGYLAGKSFECGRYAPDASGTVRYYRQRLLKTWLPTVIFVLAEMLISHPQSLKGNRKLILRLFTFTFNGGGGYSGMGHTWYIFILMWLYMFTPLTALLMKKLRGASQRNFLLRKAPAVILAFIAIAGFAYRIIALKSRLNWYYLVYTPPFGNIDLYFSGFLFAYILPEMKKPDNKTRKTVLKVAAAALFIGFILFNSWFYLMTTPGRFSVRTYQYFFPTCYIIVVLFYLFAFDAANSHQKRKQATFRTILRHPLRITDAFASVSFWAYLFHIEVKKHLLEMFGTADTFTRYILFFITAISISCLFGKIYGDGVTLLIKNGENFVKDAYLRLRRRKTASS
ncbi:MAG: acyltransferase [Clostridia bacterium]|nr:acyltransferase [Clostridia bacterium]